MSRAAERAASRRDAWLPVVCLALAVASLFLPADAGYRIAAILRDTVLRPLILLQENASEGRVSRARLLALAAERDSLVLLAQGLRPLEDENRRLRGLLDLAPRVGASSIPAEVLHQSEPTDGRMLLLSVGRAQGVVPFRPVVAPEGLVGMIRTVAGGSSAALTWAHPEFRASGVTADGKVYGIVAPTGAPLASATTLEFRAMTYRDTVPNGTLVVSSGLGGVFPRGVPVGRVAGIAREQVGWERVYRLAPAVNLGALAHVLVLREPASAVGQAFTPPEAMP